LVELLIHLDFHDFWESLPFIFKGKGETHLHLLLSSSQEKERRTSTFLLLPWRTEGVSIERKGIE